MSPENQNKQFPLYPEGVWTPPCRVVCVCVCAVWKVAAGMRPTYVVPAVHLYSPTPLPYAGSQWVGSVCCSRRLPCVSAFWWAVAAFLYFLRRTNNRFAVCSSGLASDVAWFWWFCCFKVYITVMNWNSSRALCLSVCLSLSLSLSHSLSLHFNVHFQVDLG